MFKVGDKVKIKASVERPFHGWSGSGNEKNEVGKVLQVADDLIMVDFPSYSSWSAKPDELELADHTVMYKGFRLENGRLTSLVHWTDGSFTNYLEKKEIKAPTLTYKEGEITYAPRDTAGIFICKTLEDAQKTVKENHGQGHCVVHEITALGNIKEYDFQSINYLVCPAILVGKRVWEYNAPVPKLVWEDVTTKCGVRITHGINSNWVSIMNPDHPELEIFLLGPTGFHPWGEAKDGKFKLEPVSSGYPSGGFKIMKKVG